MGSSRCAIKAGRVEIDMVGGSRGLERRPEPENSHISCIRAPRAASTPTSCAEACRVATIAERELDPHGAPACARPTIICAGAGESRGPSLPEWRGPRHVVGGLTREVPMRSFILACIAVAVIAVVGAAVLSELQESSKEAFSTEAARL
jgi:hypothetical protein